MGRTAADGYWPQMLELLNVQVRATGSDVRELQQATGAAPMHMEQTRLHAQSMGGINVPS
jgi:hypothetical protein